MTNETMETREMLVNEGFEKLMNRANEIQSKCFDRLVKVSEIRMTEDLRLAGSPLSQLATGHLCGKLKVPGRYFTRLVESGNNKLATENINCWLTEDDKRKFLLREYDGHIRGVLSGSYSVFDAPEILKTVAEVFEPTNFKLKGSFINEERLHLRLCENQMMDVEGEDLFAGITLDSSDVGRAGLSVKFFIWKQVCTNGLIIAKSSARMFKQKHIGITSEDFAAGLTEGLQTFYELKDSIVESINLTKEIPLNEDIEALVKEIQEKTLLSEEVTYEVLNLVDKNYERNRWGLINGITEIAQQYTLERRLELETIAGSMLKIA